MLSVIFIWIYMAATVFLLGYGVLTGLSTVVNYRIKRWDGYIMCGLACAAIYAQFFSIFAPVGAAANLLLVIVCLLIAFFGRKRLREDWKRLGLGRKWQEGDGAFRGKILVKGFFFFLLLLLYAYGTSRGILHYDTALYHAQSIRWIEEYGVVKGLGNLHCRLAYNSASFALSALYGMAFLGGQSYHCAAGFLALAVAFVCLELGKIVERKKLCPSDFARAACIYYLLMIFDEMISPASDYFMVLTAFYLVIRWTDLLEEKEKAVFPYAMLCVLGVFLMTIKLSAALIILFVCAPASVLLREKRWKETGIYIGLGILAAAPFLIRNVLLSGWLVYPFTGLDLFSVDWKIPKGIAAYDAKEIQVWGRGYSDVAKFDLSAREWMPAWFRGLGGMDKLFVLLAMLSAAVFAVRLMLWLMRRKKVRPEKLLLEGVISLCFLFWLFSSPLIRYGCVYVYLTTAVVWGDVCTEFFENARLNHWKAGQYAERACMLFLGLFLIYKAAAFGREVCAFYVNDYWLYQKDYENYKVRDYEIDGVVFYCPVEGDRVGYDSFPSSPTEAKISLRGDGIGDGFRYAE